MSLCFVSSWTYTIAASAFFCNDLNIDEGCQWRQWWWCFSWVVDLQIDCSTAFTFILSKGITVVEIRIQLYVHIQIYANTKTNRLLNCLHFLVEGWISQMQGPAWCDALWCMCTILHPHRPAFLKDQHNHLYHQHHHHWNINPWSTLKTSLSMI